MQDYLTTPITNNEEAKRYIFKLYCDHNLYHLDENASSIINFQTGKPAFTPEECELLDKRRDEVFEHMAIDPHQLCCALQDIPL